MKASLILSLLVAIAALPQVRAQSAVDTAQPKAEEKSAETKSVQPQVESDVAKKSEEQRKKILTDAETALAETKKALGLLEEKKNSEALAALELATGKLELILARDPKLALAPVDTQVVIHDLYAKPDTVKDILKTARELLGNGEVQKARPMLATLASEIVYETTNLPLVTYPAAIKEAVRLIDTGKIDEAQTILRTALNTLVITSVAVPLPPLRAEAMLKEAQKLAENDKRDSKQNEELAKLLADVRTQVQMAEVLGYGKKDDFKPIYEQIKQIEQKTSGGKSGKGWFDKIKAQVSELF